ncbi:MAG TPA: hypothetical protein VN634_01070 [Candidatus Limnocylindrales bacterium]|jgi:hypothetical protein|nr:hypothetical protein [Candidatus Limnocylindrales bacterium]
MIRELFVSAVVALASMLGPLLAHQADAQTTASTLIAFDTMYGVDGPFVHHKLRGLVGDDLPWEIESAVGSVDTSGHVTIAVRGLVFADDPSVPINLRGTNDAAEFRAGVSCITEAGNALKRVLVMTDGFPATTQGDGDINGQVELPNPCVAPVVFVMPGDEKDWFAVTGFESEEDED